MKKKSRIISRVPFAAHSEGRAVMSKKPVGNERFQYGERASGACSKVYISTAALRTILHSNAIVNKQGFLKEDGSFLVGAFYRDPEAPGKVIACVKEAIDGGIQTRKTYASYEFDSEYINHTLQFLRDRHAGGMQLIGMVHFHPGRLNVFSGVDISTNIDYTRDCSVGWCSGIFTMADNVLELWMYFCENSNGRVLCTAVPAEVSDEAILRLDQRFRVPRTLEEIFRDENVRVAPKIAIDMDDEAAARLMGKPAAALPQDVELRASDMPAAVAGMGEGVIDDTLPRGPEPTDRPEPLRAEDAPEPVDALEEGMIRTMLENIVSFSVKSEYGALSGHLEGERMRIWFASEDRSGARRSFLFDMERDELGLTGLLVPLRRHVCGGGAGMLVRVGAPRFL